MSVQTSLARDTAVKRFTAAAKLLCGQRVAFDDGELVVASGTTVGAGVVLGDTEIGEEASLVFFGSGHPAYVRAADGAITPGQTLIAVASGRLDAGTTGNIVAIATEASTAQDHLIEAILGVPSVTTS